MSRVEPPDALAILELEPDTGWGSSSSRSRSRSESESELSGLATGESGGFAGVWYEVEGGIPASAGGLERSVLRPRGFVVVGYISWVVVRNG